MTPSRISLLRHFPAPVQRLLAALYIASVVWLLWSYFGTRLRAEQGQSSFLIGKELARQEEFREALPPLRQAVDLLPEEVVARRELGNVLDHLGQVKEAWTQAKEAERLAPQDGAVHNQCAAYLLEMGQVEEAITECHAGLSLEPSDGHGHDTLGQALLRKGQIDDALKECKAAINSRPQNGYNPTFLNDLGYLQWLKGDRQRARKTWKIALGNAYLDPRERTRSEKYLQEFRVNDVTAKDSFPPNGPSLPR